MEKSLVTEVMRCLCGERTVFHYSPDQYAIYLIRKVLGDKERIALNDLRKSRWASLLHRPLIRHLISTCGDGYIYRSRLENVCFDNSEPFVLTLGEWGCKKDWSWNQTSRPGSNLVLQLNLSRKWSKKFESLQKETANEYTGFHHPVSNSRSATLAWARMDMDFETDEVLIEEIQSDLFKDILSMHNDAKLEQKEKSKTFYNWGATIRTDEFLNFSEAFIKQFGKSWQEAMLAASVYFVFEELGCSKIYYHSFETGNQMKNLDSCKPPKSLYTDLPKKFCFESIDSAPEFLSKEKRIRRKLKKLDGGRWFCMAA